MCDLATISRSGTTAIRVGARWPMQHGKYEVGAYHVPTNITRHTCLALPYEYAPQENNSPNHTRTERALGATPSWPGATVS